MNRISLVMIGVVVMAACGDSTGPAAGTSVSLTFASDVPAAAAAAPGAPTGAALVPISDGTNTLDITSVKVVLREIELEGTETEDCDVEPEPEGCESFETGPVLVDVPVDGSTTHDVSIVVPAGSYDEVEFDLHEVTSDDGAFLDAHPEMEGKSILVEGTYNGDPFTFESNMSQEQEIELPSPLVVTDGDTPTNVTIRFDVSTWFLDGAGNFLDPSTASTGQPNESVVEENIQNSMKVFEDRDMDGDETDED